MRTSRGWRADAMAAHAGRSGSAEVNEAAGALAVSGFSPLFRISH